VALRVLITGASGLLGAKLTEAASNAGHDVHPVYNQHQILGPNALHVDLTDQQSINTMMSKTSPEIVIHCASITDVDLCERDPKAAFLVNETVTEMLARECARTKSHFVFASTDYVFDGQRGDYSEGDNPNPVNIYGRSKLAGEQATRRASESFAIARTSVIYGWGRTFRPNFGTWVYGELKAARAVKVVQDQYASPTLNSHLAKMLLEVAEKHVSGIIHLAGATRASRYELAQEIARGLGMSNELIVPTDSKSAPWTAKRPPDSSLCVREARRLLSIKPLGIREAVGEFAKEHAN